MASRGILMAVAKAAALALGVAASCAACADSTPPVSASGAPTDAAPAMWAFSEAEVASDDPVAVVAARDRAVARWVDATTLEVVRRDLAGCLAEPVATSFTAPDAYVIQLAYPERPDIQGCDAKAGYFVTTFTAVPRPGSEPARLSITGLESGDVELEIPAFGG